MARYFPSNCQLVFCPASTMYCSCHKINLSNICQASMAANTLITFQAEVRMGEGGGQQYCLKWNNYQVKNVTDVFFANSWWPLAEYLSPSWSLFRRACPPLSRTFLPRTPLLMSPSPVRDKRYHYCPMYMPNGHVHWTIMVLPILIVTPQAKEWLMIHFQIVRAHRLLLSACSPYFRRLLSGLTSCQHPIIILRWSPSQGNADASDLFQRRKSFRLGGDLGVHLQWRSEHRARVSARLPGSRWNSPHTRPHRRGLPPHIRSNIQYFRLS